MSYPVISIEHLTKQYDLGVIGTGTLSRDLNRWWARLRQHPDPYTRIGHKDAFARFGESILALDNVSFTVQQGEALGIIGRNGAGKSTLLKILSRVTAPTSGEVKVKGRIGSLLEVGTGFHPELTGRENVYLNGAILGMRKDEVTHKFDEIVNFSGVEKFIDTPVKRYSSGMYVRLAFAVAAHLDPEILVVDEVLAVGDAEFQKKCLGKMGDVAGEGRTILFVSHNMPAIQKLCSRTLVIQDGKIIYNGESEEAIENYLANSVSNTKNGDLSLSNIERSGSGSVCFNKVLFLSEKEEFLTQLPVGKQIKIMLEVVGHKAKESVEIGIAIFNSKNYRVCGLNSRDINNFTFDIEADQKKRFVCTIEDQNLAPDNYYLTLMLRARGKEILDYIDQACSLEIIPADYFDTGKLPQGENIILLKPQWVYIGQE